MEPEPPLSSCSWLWCPSRSQQVACESRAVRFAFFRFLVKVKVQPPVPGPPLARSQWVPTQGLTHRQAFWWVGISCLRLCPTPPALLCPPFLPGSPCLSEKGLRGPVCLRTILPCQFQLFCWFWVSRGKDSLGIFENRNAEIHAKPDHWGLSPSSSLTSTCTTGCGICGVCVCTCICECMCMLRSHAQDDIGTLGDGICLHGQLEKAWGNWRSA